MDALEVWFLKLRAAIRKIPTAVKVLVVVGLALLVGAIVVVQSGVLETAFMSEGERVQYLAAKEREKEQLNATMALQEQAETEEKNGYRRFDSPNLTQLEKAAISFLNACRDKDYDAVAEAVDCINVFNDDNFGAWLQANGLSLFLEQPETGEDRNIAVLARDIMDKNGKEVIGQEPVVVVWRGEDTSNKAVIPYTEEPDRFVFTPDNSFETDKMFLLPVNKADFGAVDMTPYIGKTVESNKNTWYECSVPKIPTVDNIDIVLHTEIGDYSGIVDPVVSEANRSYDNVVVADFTDEEIDAFSNSVSEAISHTISLVNNKASDEEIAAYMAVSDVLDDISPSQNKEDDKVVLSLQDVTNVDVIRDETVADGETIGYNYHLCDNNTVSCKVNIRFGLSGGGECRRKATVSIRRIGDNLCIVSVDKNFFARIDRLDPEW